MCGLRYRAQSPCASSAWRHAVGQSYGPLSARGPAACARRQTDRPDEARQPDASAERCCRHRRRLVIHCGPGQLQQLALPPYRQWIGSVDYRVALRKPALVSTPSQQSCSRASCPILAWRVLRFGVSAVGVDPPNTSAARASHCGFHLVIWVGWTRNCSAHSVRF
jgi:hypothetical protein